MKRKLLILILCSAVVLSMTASFAGKPDKDWKNWYGHFSTGLSLPQGTFSDIAEDDWVLYGGATYWPEDWPIGIDLELAYNGFDLNNAAIDAINDAIGDDPGNTGEITGGSIDVLSMTVDGIWSPGTGKISPYIMAGVGGYYIDGEITSQGIVYYPPICDPWFWWCYPGGVGPGTIVQNSVSTTKFGYNVGIGVNFEVSNGSQVYIEAKYMRIETNREPTEYIPIVVGYRW
jgi:opacity protein-like surface antigen